MEAEVLQLLPIQVLLRAFSLKLAFLLAWEQVYPLQILLYH